MSPAAPAKAPTVRVERSGRRAYEESHVISGVGVWGPTFCASTVEAFALRVDRFCQNLGPNVAVS